MSKVNSEPPNNVVSIRPPKASKASERKWGKDVMDLGFCIVPTLLLRAQQRLGLNPTQLAVLMQLCDFWWEDSRKPYPSKEALSDRLGLSARQVQRIIAELESAGLVTRIERHHPGHGGKLSNIYDLSGLVAKLKKLEPDFRAVEDDVKKARKAVRKKNFRRVRPPAPVTNTGT